MKIIIIEDEIPARDKIKRMLKDLAIDVQIIAEIATVIDGIDFIEKHSADLIIADIELLDGNSFEIFNTIPINCPIIFTTAYDNYWMNAFETNGIGYLLKPFTQKQFEKAWEKFTVLTKSSSEYTKLIHSINSVISQNNNSRSYKEKLIVRKKNIQQLIDIKNISLFIAEDGVLFAIESTGERHILNENTLNEIESFLNLHHFFRINRGEIINKHHIISFSRYSKNSYGIKLKGVSEIVVTSQSKTTEFGNWIKS